MSNSRTIRFTTVVTLALLFLAGCASSQIKARKDQREKAAQSSRLWCEFVNGEIFPDVDVAMNLEMAKRCDADKSYSITSYRTPSENQGVIYCCTVRETVREAGASVNSGSSAPATPAKADVKKPDAKSPDAKSPDSKSPDSKSSEEIR